MEQNQEKKSNGALVGAIIVIILIIIGGLYLMLNRETNTPITPENENMVEESLIKEENIPNGEELSSSILNSLEETEKELGNIDTEVDLQNLE